MATRLFLSLAGLSALAVLVFAVLEASGVTGPGALTLIVVLLLAALLSHLLARPLGEAARFASRLARGGSPPRLRENVAGQAGDLFRALNRLAESHRSRSAELEAEKTETDVLLREMGDGVLALGPGGNVARANAELCSVIGASEPVEGRSVASIFRNPELVDFLSPHAVPEAGASGEFDVFGHIMLVTARKLPGGGIVGVFSDVTELRRLDAVRTEFVANVSHELKTPLTAIRGYAETLLDSGIPDDDRQSFAGRIVDHAERMTALVSDMLILARLEESKTKVARECVALMPLAGQIVDSSAARAAEAGIEVGLEVQPEDLELIADREGVRQIVENLIDNAIRHAGASRITLRASRIDSARALISVRDDGRGIPAAQAERVFERFYRVDPSRTRQTGGTGLGLSIVKHWAESMHGSVRVESILNEGTTFYVELPAAS